MNPIFQALLVVCCLGAGLASQSANRYIENLLDTTWRQQAQGLDPALLPSFTAHFQSNGRVTGEVSFTNGNVTGLSWARKESECIGPRYVGSELTITCTLSFTSLNTNYRMTTKLGSVSYGMATGYMSDTAIRVVIAGHAPNYVGFVKGFQVTRMGSMTPTLKGLPGSVAWSQESYLMSVYRSNVSNFLLNVVQQKLVPALNRALSYKPMPRV